MHDSTSSIIAFLSICCYLEGSTFFPMLATAYSGDLLSHSKEYPSKKRKAVTMPSEIHYKNIAKLTHPQLGVALKKVNLGQSRPRQESVSS
jgi:hypothetical protein